MTATSTWVHERHLLCAVLCRALLLVDIQASTPQALSCCLASLARLQIIPDPSKLRGLLDASLDSLPQCTPRQLTGTGTCKWEQQPSCCIRLRQPKPVSVCCGRHMLCRYTAYDVLTKRSCVLLEQTACCCRGGRCWLLCCARAPCRPAVGVCQLQPSTQPPVAQGIPDHCCSSSRCGQVFCAAAGHAGVEPGCCQAAGSGAADVAAAAGAGAAAGGRDIAARPGAAADRARYAAGSSWQ